MVDEFLNGKLWIQINREDFLKCFYLQKMLPDAEFTSGDSLCGEYARNLLLVRETTIFLGCVNARTAQCVFSKFWDDNFKNKYYLVSIDDFIGNHANTSEIEDDEYLSVLA